MRRGAEIDGLYRYRLWREWAPELGSCCFVMLNPSTADAEQDDPTIRRCIDFVEQWGYGRLDVVNLYALRSTDPRSLRLTTFDAESRERNDRAVADAAYDARQIVAAWGVHAGLGRHLRFFHRALVHRDLHVLGLTKGGYPKHPLYLPRTTRPELWRPARMSLVREN